MSTLILLENVSTLDSAIDELKDRGGTVLTNCYLDRCELERLAAQGSLQCVFEQPEQLSLLRRQNGFNVLYIYTLCPEQYVFQTEHTTVTEVFFRRGRTTAGTDALLRSLKKSGFKEIGKYSRWVCPAGNEPVPVSICDVAVDEEMDASFLQLLGRCFDKYTDHLPSEEDIDAFRKNNYVLRLLISGQTAGGVVWNKRGRNVTEEYIFVDPAYRHRKLAAYLHGQMCAQAFRADEVGKIYAWINGANETSIRFHTSLGYSKDEMEKITLIKKGGKGHGREGS